MPHSGGFIKSFLEEHGEGVFEMALAEANYNLVATIGNDTRGDIIPIAQASVNQAGDKLYTLEHFLTEVGVDRHAGELGTTREGFIVAATAWYDEFHENNVRIDEGARREVTMTGHMAGMPMGLKKAIHRHFADADENGCGPSCPNPDCNFKLPRYPGRYVRFCPSCNQNMTEGITLSKHR